MIRTFQGKEPEIHPEAYVDPAAIVIGDVHIGKQSTIWPSAVLRGDLNQIRVGKRTSIQDNVSVHPDPETAVIIGDECVVGHNAVLHTTHLEPHVLVGMGAVVNDSHIERNSVIAAGAVVHNQHIEPRSMVMGVPGKTRRSLSDDETQMIQRMVEEYTQLGERHKG